MIFGQLERDARWHATEGRPRDGKDLHPGDVVAIDYPPMRHKPWVVHSTREREEGRWSLTLRPVGAQFDLAEFDTNLTMRRWARVEVLPEHYAVCHECGEIPPCRERWAAGIADAVAERAARYDVPGVCPACEEPITRRQKTIRFEENIYVPLGHPVTFHERAKCWGIAEHYDRQVAKLTGREPRLSCEGTLIQHNDGQRLCTNITCPGDRLVRHRGFAMCYVLREKCNRVECWEDAS